MKYYLKCWNRFVHAFAGHMFGEKPLKISHRTGKPKFMVYALRGAQDVNSHDCI